MNGIGVPIVTPFGEDGSVATDQLAALTETLEQLGVDFFVPCGSTGEAPALTSAEREQVLATVVEATDAPVLAGTGQPGLTGTINETRLAEQAGADGALVVTPYYYNHGQETLRRYYQKLADAVDIPIYLYSVPKFTDISIDPDVVDDLAGHQYIHGMKDSSGSVGNLVRILNRTESADFDAFVGSGSIIAQGLSLGAAGGILAVANLVPEVASDISAAVEAGDERTARQLNADIAEINHAVTSEYGVGALKWAMRQRGLPAGGLREPFAPPEPAIRDHLTELLEDVEATTT